LNQQEFIEGIKPVEQFSKVTVSKKIKKAVQSKMEGNIKAILNKFKKPFADDNI